MDHCVLCGHALGIGRFCTNCGHPIDQPAPADDWRGSTAERGGSLAPPTVIAPASPPAGPPAGSPVEPPTAFAAPPEARYPLYADEVGTARDPLWRGTGEAEPRRRVLPWVAVAVALALVAVASIGVVLVVGGGDDPQAATEAPSSPSSPATSDAGDSASSDPPVTSDPQTPPGTPDPPSAGSEDVASLATAIPPATAPPSTDSQGNAVRFDAFNMLDGQPDTAWRMAGSAARTEIGIDLAAPTRIDQVGMINGYAKSYPGYDGYSANRRVLVVQWVFDDGTKVRQRLNEVDTLQLVPAGGVVTSSIRLQIIKVSQPGRPPYGRDFTAISDLALVGVPQG